LRNCISGPSRSFESMKAKIQKITTFLWFDGQAEEAAHFYISIFADSKILSVTRVCEAVAKVSGRPKDSVMTVKFQLEGQEFMALNGGPLFKFTEAISLVMNCETQKEIDKFWTKLSAGGEKSRCGWLKDKYSLWWQIVPADLDELLTSKDGRETERVMQALLQMDKLDIKTLRKACQE
jgi:predicted 3-demethylubiquinone-9 3-methyltransferase (glyoxalase superfamily)